MKAIQTSILLILLLLLTNSFHFGNLLAETIPQYLANNSDSSSKFLLKQIKVQGGTVFLDSEIKSVFRQYPAFLTN